MSQEKYIALLFKKRTQGLSEAEIKELKALELKISDTPDISANDIDQIYSLTSNYHHSNPKDLDMNQTFTDLIQARNRSKANGTSRHPRLFNLKVVSGIAASFIMLIGALFWMYNRSDVQQLVMVIAKENDQELLLSDGSRLRMKKNSTVKYLPFNKDLRELHTTGEVHAQIAKEKRPFVIRTRQGDVQVLGTSFLLKSGLRMHQFAIKILEGKVNLRLDQAETKNTPKNQILSTGESFNLSSSIDPTNKDLWSWTRPNLTFKQTPLRKAVLTLASYFQVSIAVDPSIADCSLTIDFKNEDLHTILSSIDVIFNSTYSQLSNTSYELIGGSCQE